MSNQMYNRFGGSQNSMDGMVGRIKQFQNTLKGNPEEQLQSMINSGKVPQGVLNRAQQMAKPIYDIMRGL